MGSWWRSEEMAFVNLIVTEEASQAVVRELGALGCIQFVDLNPEMTAFQRPYMTTLKRCEELERKIRYCSTEVSRMGITIQPAGDVEEFVNKKHNDDMDSRTGMYLLEGLESELDQKETQLRHLVEYNNKLSKQYTSKVEYHHLLVQAAKFLNTASDLDKNGGGESSSGSSSLSMHPDAEEGISMASMGGGGGGSSYQDDYSMSFSNISGVLSTIDKSRFERMLFRATRGNCYVRFSELPKEALDADGKTIEKSCFVVFYKSKTLDIKIGRICDAFGASRFDLSMINSPSHLRAARDSNYQDLLDAKLVLDTNTTLRVELCELLAGTLETWFWIVKREKSVYHTLNCFKANVAGAKQLVRARGWLVKGSVEEANSALRRAHMAVGLPHQSALLESVPGNWPTPPTHYYTNKYTYAFQELVNTYGMPRYREINPALFAAATFPFLFGVMYGDIGHGFCLTMGALYLVFTEGRMNDKRNMDGMMYNVYQARYMLLFMGVCAVYCGTVYNDYFSLGLDVFGSSYVFPESGEKSPGAEQASEVDPKIENGAVASLVGESGDPNSVYPYGCDPVWHVAGNELLFFNSMKMKMAVILGLLQMTWGIILRGFNAVYTGGFGIDFFCEFLPMIIFDVFFMGYIVVLIFMKWAIDWNYRMGLGSCGYDKHGTLGGCDLGSSKSCYSVAGDVCDKNTPLTDLCPLDFGGTGDGCQPPSLITTLMNIALKPGQVDEPLYYGQAQVQVVLLFIAFICVPWLMIAKPYFLYKQHHAEHSDKHHYTSIGDAGALPLIDERRSAAAGGTNKNPMYDSVEGLDADSMNANSSHPLNPSAGGLNHRRSFSMDSTHSDDSMFGVGIGGEGGYKDSGGHGDGDDWNFPEICIHQGIETIEFVLGMISNTASYLRLWALSLAHSELSTVFWEKALLGAIKSGNPIFIFAGFFVFAGVTFGVLLGMDLLECFLHALRLHWVEFQNKFYKADGYRFVPFSFHDLLDDAVLS
jgi:V-type H+-transporting ATPase subunit a